jgi:hypothetical protein
MAISNEKKFFDFCKKYIMIDIKGCEFKNFFYELNSLIKLPIQGNLSNFPPIFNISISESKFS